ncbi:MAG: hypothetical protein AMK71_08880 [Nitrospira bacterium SG8_35_4]|nr:MAG: hypothetical protein AMK71_08880 [Nitrospira bacterium SG8_35_4]
MRKCICILILIFLLAGCSDKKKSLDLESIGEQGIKSRSAQFGDIRIYPDDPTVETVISLSTDGQILEGAKINWYINDIKEESSIGLNFSSDALRKGDTVKAVLVKNGNTFESNELTVRNTPPAIIISELLPAKPKVDSNFTVTISAKDVDNDVINYRYKWTVNDIFASEMPYLNTELKSGDKVTVEVTPYDKDGSGKSVRMTRKVLNSLPVFSESKPVFEGTLYKYQVQATDPDNDVLAFKLEKGPEGMTIDPASGLITWEVKPQDKGYHDIEVRVTDNNGGSLIIPFTTRIGFQ